MKTDLALSHLTVQSGQNARIDIDVTNTATVIDGVTAIVDGLNPDWIRLEQPLVSLFPEESGVVSLLFDIPRSCPAGDYLIVARIVSTVDADRQTVHDFWLTVEPYNALELTLRPRIANGGKKGRITTTILNTGNAESTIRLSAVEPTRAASCKLEASSVRLLPGHEALLDIDITGPRPWFGQTLARTIVVTAQVDDTLVEELGTFNQRPRIPRGVITILTLAMIIALWALIFFLVITRLGASEKPEKAISEDFLVGAVNVPLANVAGSAGGTVIASTTKEGLPRITVEALRIGPESKLLSVGSAATGDDGTFTLPSLLPGTYKFRVSGDGFGEVWFPNAASEAEADAVPVNPTEPTPNINVELTGALGSLTGQIELPPDAGLIEFTVTATQVVEQSGSDPALSPAPVSVTQVTTDGSIELNGLPTPATYTITVTGPGFETQQFEQQLDGGDATALNTVVLSAAVGSISGTVLGDNDAPLGGVTVSARSGDIEYEVTTPTTGNRGQFEIIGLATPETYVLTFELENYSSATLAVALVAGADNPGVIARLVGGSGSITGSAVDANGSPLGGVVVEVEGDGFVTETSTLTTSGADAPAGSFALSELPVPGDYTLTFSADGFQNESVAVTFSGAGTQSVGSVTMASATAQVSGTVLGSGSGVGGLTITLTDGLKPRSTTSATNPPGVFAFVDVPPGSYTLTFTDPSPAPRFEDRVLLVRVTGGIDVSRTVTLVALGS
jgi:hypothetical protein